ncbi:hypothetical protein [Massilia psychrophila]|uniref:Uncharacterized protein n=1 Tax=Massilia psychrophila TaxID=1603353 RepID=A0A2G8T5C6_9BURK|nr:hypothetical protein [Massilia psychrophila]PIL41212.1 hypothetical protein CR103_03735 [Massilia psychrophila]GGE67509.1 hypothetical protein GCM10008020_09900 [Massilia psychrophila]
MRRRFGQGLRLGVAASALALVQTRRWGGPAELLAEQPYASVGALPDALAALLGGGYAGWPLTIVLSDELVRMWQVTPPAQTTRLADLEAAAALRFQRLYGEPAADWIVRAGWDAGQPFLAAAMPRALLAALGQGAAMQHMKLVEIVPQFVALLNRCRGELAAGAWFGTLHDKVLTLGAREGGLLVAVRAQALPAAPGPLWLAEHLAREALRLNLAAPNRLQLWGAPPTWLGAGTTTTTTTLGSPGAAGWTQAAVLAASGSAA